MFFYENANVNQLQKKHNGIRLMLVSLCFAYVQVYKRRTSLSTSFSSVQLSPHVQVTHFNATIRYELAINASEPVVVRIASPKINHLLI